MHALNVANHVVQGRIVGQNEILVHRQAEVRANIGHDFGLLDRINAEFALQILVQLDEICGVASVVDHDLDDGGHDRLIVHGGGCGRDVRRRLNRGGGWEFRGLLRGRCRSRRCNRRQSMPFVRRRSEPGFALYASMQVVVPVHIGHQLLLKNAHHNVVGACQGANPCHPTGPINALALHRPFAHQGKGDLRAETSSESKAVGDVRVIATR